jgi:hypothetical protein
MLAEGLTLSLFAWILNALGLLFGAALGARGLLDPKWAQHLVRLQPDEQGGGFAEFRATYGGVFLGMHAVALLLTLRWLLAGGGLVGVTAAGASAAVAAAWGGAAAGRLLSMLRDKSRTRFNDLSVAIEIALAAAIAAPWFVWIAGGPSG